ncbi:autoinducer 2 aldolase [Salmonella enterica subsp. enterica serovar Typhimurium]
MADLDDIKDGKDFHTDKPQTNTLFALKGCGALDWGMQSRLARILIPRPEKRSCWPLTMDISRGRQPDLSVLISILRRSLNMLMS